MDSLPTSFEFVRALESIAFDSPEFYDAADKILPF
jgi:hypothetical protein